MSLTRQVEANIPQPNGMFKLLAYAHSENEQIPHLAIVSGEIDVTSPVNVRLHSECITGDVFGSSRCDCGAQLNGSLQYIGKEGGVVIYLRQEGRGIGIINKLKAYNLQDKGINTADANIHLGFEVDSRTYEEALIILKDLKISKINLLTNNPKKIEAFENSEIEIFERIPIEIPANHFNHEYLQTKKDIMGHLLHL